MNHLKNVHQAKFSFVCVLFATGKCLFFLTSLSFLILRDVSLLLTGEIYLLATSCRSTMSQLGNILCSPNSPWNELRFFCRDLLNASIAISWTLHGESCYNGTAKKINSKTMLCEHKFSFLTTVCVQRWTQFCGESSLLVFLVSSWWMTMTISSSSLTSVHGNETFWFLNLHVFVLIFFRGFLKAVEQFRFIRCIKCSRSAHNKRGNLMMPQTF